MSTRAAARKVGVLLNGDSGKGRGAKIREQVFAGLAADGFETMDLSGPDLVTAIRRARAGLAEGIEALIAVGGDGTVHGGVNVVAGTGVPLGIIASGTGNDLARALDLPRHDVAASLAIVREGLAERQDGKSGVRFVDAVGVSGPGGPVKYWYLAVLSCGLDAAVAARANQLRWPSGAGRYLRAVGAELGHFQPYGYRVTMDGEVWESHGTLVAVANTGIFGGGMKIAPQAVPDDGMLDVVFARGLSRHRIAALFPRLYTGSHLKHPEVHIRRARSVRIEALPELGAPPPMAFADGEPLRDLPVQCDVHPLAVGVLAPRGTT